MANLSKHSPKGKGHDFVQLVLTESAPLGMEISRDEDGAISVSKFQTGGQAERSSTEAMMDPQVFQNVAFLGVNGIGPSSGDTTVLLTELNNDCRPKSILFGVNKDQGGIISHAIDVHKRYGNFVELVFRKTIMGIKLNKAHDFFLQVDGFQENMEALAICRECLLDPIIFKGASIVRVNGKPFQDKIGVYEALKSPKRPKAILFELAKDHAAATLGPVDAVMARTTPTPKIERRASLKMRERAAFASTSMRTLAVDDYDRRNDLLSSINESIPQLEMEEEGKNNRPYGLCRLSDMSESIRQLQVSIAEMDELNVMNDQQALSRSNSSVVEVEESPRTTKARAILRGIKKLSIGDSWKGRFQRRTESGSSMPSSVDADSFDDEKSLEDVKKEAYEACLCAIRDHLDAFLSETPNVSYEEWIEELHPENAQSRYNLVGGKSIDHRFYVEGSDHRRLWNERSGRGREFAPVREYLPGATGGHATASKAPKTARSPPVRNSGLSVDTRSPTR